MAKHATYAPSSAARWLICPFSAEASKDLPERESDAANEGKRVHALVEEAIRSGSTDHVDEGDAAYDAVALTLGYVRALGGGEIATEKTVRLSDDVWGTADIIHVTPGVITIPDYKNGAYDVDAVDNKQLLTYAAAMLDSGAAWFRLVAIQPTSRSRGEQEPVKQWVVPRSVVEAHKDRVLEAVKRGRAGEPPQPGKHCRWCPAFGECAATRAVMPLIERALELGVEQLTDDKIVYVARVLRSIGDFRKLVDAEINKRALAGAKLDGVTLEPARTFRRWKDDNLAKQRLYEAFGDDGVSPVSVAQAEKLGGAGREIAKFLAFRPPGQVKASY